MKKMGKGGKRKDSDSVDKGKGQAKARARTTTTPPGWPPNVRYLASCVPSPGLPKPLQDIFCSPTPSSSSHLAVIPITSAAHPFDHASLSPPYPLVRIRQIVASPSHPALGQYGLFATRRIPPRTFLLPYFGVVHTQEEADERSDYDLGLGSSSSSSDGDDVGTPTAAAVGGDRVRLGVDAASAGNEARMINDYRGILPRPNCVFGDWEYTIVRPSAPPFSPPSSAPPVRRRGIGVWTGSREVQKGEELCVSYGKGFWASRRPADGQGEGEEREGDASP